MKAQWHYDFGYRLNSHLTRRFTSAELAEKIGVKPKKIIAWRNGRMMPSRIMIERIAKVLRLNPDYLRLGPKIETLRYTKSAVRKQAHPAMSKLNKIMGYPQGRAA